MRFLFWLKLWEFLKVFLILSVSLLVMVVLVIIFMVFFYICFLVIWVLYRFSIFGFVFIIWKLWWLLFNDKGMLVLIMGCFFCRKGVVVLIGIFLVGVLIWYMLLRMSCRGLFLVLMIRLMLARFFLNFFCSWLFSMSRREIRLMFSLKRMRLRSIFSGLLVRFF